MPSETFHCPHCGRELKKSAQAYVLGEILSDKNASFIGLGEPAKAVTCPGCGKAIDAQRMMRGDYDSGFTNAGCWTGFVSGAAGGIALCYFGDAPWWMGLIACLIIAGGIGQLVSRFQFRRQ